MCIIFIHDLDFWFLFFITDFFYLGCPFINLCTSKVASLWFNQDQTALANSIMSLSIPLGFMLAYILGTEVVTSSSKSGFTIITTVYTIIISIGTVLTTIFLKYPHGSFKGTPRIPPSEASTKPQMMFFESLKKLVVNKYYWIHFLGSTASIGYFLVLAVNTTLILCPLGFSQNFSSIDSITYEIISGFIAGLLISIFIQKTYKSTFFNTPFILWTARILLSIYALNLWFLMAAFTTRFTTAGYDLAIPAFIILGVTGMPLLPISFEIAIETSFPAGQATSTGFLWIFGQAWAFVFTLIINGLKTTNFPENWGSDYQNNSCANGNGSTEENYYYKTPLIVLASVCTIFVLVWLVGMRCKFLRRNS